MPDTLSAVDARLDEYVEQFALQVSHRTVTRNFRDRADIPSRKLQDGVFTVIYEGMRPHDADRDVLMVLVVGQIELSEKSTPEEVERAELVLQEEFTRFIKSIHGGAWKIKSLATSHQVEHPFGWFYAQCEIGPEIFAWEDPEGGHMPVDVMIGRVPDVGPGHETDYTHMSEFINDPD